MSKEDETAEECFIREFYEEAGIMLNKRKLISLCDYLVKKFNAYRYIFYTESDLDKSKMRLGEGADFSWHPINKVFDLSLLCPRTKKDLELFISRIFKN